MYILSVSALKHARFILFLDNINERPQTARTVLIGR